MKSLLSLVDKHKQLIRDAHSFIWANPETGYKEFKTSKYLEDKFIEFGYDIVRAENIPGFYATLDTGKPGPTVLILGELDSVICPSHPECDKTTGAVHACGHGAQCAALLGIAATLKEPHALDNLSGKIKLCAVPAEELLEIDYRMRLKKDGIIKYLGGKSEFLYRGYFDDVDMAFMIHTTSLNYNTCRQGSVGFITKNIIYKGLAAHAGGSPGLGRNALYAANCGLNACNALRETFEENDIIRFHPIITSGGSIVNAIPERCTIETYVRAKTFEAMEKANKRLNQALIGGALSLDCNVEIVDIPGYAPLINDPNMIELAKDAIGQALPNEKFIYNDSYGSGSTDMGDLSCIMPVVHPYAMGATGKGHGNDYYVYDVEKACVNSAKWQVAMLYLLLKDGAERANKILKEFVPAFKNKEEFFDLCDKLYRDGDRISYTELGANVKL